MRRVLIALAGLAACSRQSPTPSASAPTPAPAQAAAVADEAPSELAAGGGSPAAAAQTPAPKPEPPKLPDGRPIATCDYDVANMSCIPGGKFVRGRDDGPDNERPRAEVWLQTFFMDRYEVTLSEYKACTKAGKCRVGGPFYGDFSRPNQPIVGMSWLGAREFCKWMGKQLPSEAQWEGAARGPEGELYPWGNEPEPTCKNSIIKDSRGRSCGTPKNYGEMQWKGRTYVVGSRAPARYGLYDMVGNAWEYVDDWYAESFEQCGEACLGVDPKGPCPGKDKCRGHTHKMVKGGSWYWGPDRATGTFRRAQKPNNRPFHHFGFRCAATVDQAKELNGKPRNENQPDPEVPSSDAKRGL